MGFFAEFSTWLNGVLLNYIGTNTALIASTLEPAIVTLGVIYVMVWGYLELTGQIEEPFVTGVKRIAVLGVIFGLALHLWLYNALIVDTFFNAPAELGAVVIGAYNPVTIVDQILFSASDAANLLLAKAGVFHGNFSYYLAAGAVYLIVGLTAIYTMFLLSLSKIALSVLLALGPLFLAFLLFPTTKRFFEAWLAQLANYAFITILTVLLAALMLNVVAKASQAAVATGGGIQIADAVRLCLASGLTFLVMRQVMPMAASLATGLALSTFGVTSALIAWGLGSALRTGGQFMRGLTDSQTARGDSFTRKAGYYAKAGVAGGAGALTRGVRKMRRNEIRSEG
jgi:type IV secretion system protein VirB6